VRALALSICADIHPLHNSRVLKYLEGELGQGNAENPMDMSLDCHRLCRTGAAIGQPAGTYAVTPGLLDACLVPQVFAARRFGLDLTPYPHIVRIDAAWPACRPLRCPSGTAGGCAGLTSR
jgi:glutathione S-transferase